MSTICFDIKRYNSNYVCITKAGLNKFEYNTHLPFTYDHKIEYTKVEKDIYIYLLIGADTKADGIERILIASNNPFDCCLSYKTAEEKIYTNVRMITVPIWNSNNGIYESNDLGDCFKLYCPEELNKCHRYYGTFEEVVGEKGKKEYVWYPPLQMTLKEEES